MRKLTEKQKRFINEYLIDTNATQAAIRAGYSRKSARYTARDLLSRPQIAKEIQEQLAIIDIAKVCTIQEVMEYLTAVMRGETTSTVKVCNMTDAQLVMTRFKKAKSHKDALLKQAATAEYHRRKAAARLGGTV